MSDTAVPAANEPEPADQTEPVTFDTDAVRTAVDALANLDRQDRSPIVVLRAASKAAGVAAAEHAAEQLRSAGRTVLVDPTLGAFMDLVSRRKDGQGEAVVLTGAKADPEWMERFARTARATDSPLVKAETVDTTTNTVVAELATTVTI